MRIFATIILISATGAAQAHPWDGSDIVILGEVHDNETHHTIQADLIDHTAPAAVVFEMLTPGEATLVNDTPPEQRSDVDYSAFHWANIETYSALFSTSAQVVGAALPRQDVRAAFADGAASVFGPDASLYGLSGPVPDPELTDRKKLQFAAHCEAMPLELMGGMVEAQRLRDAHFARVTLDALRTHGPPVILVTGNGHARPDWGVPSYLARVAPDVTVFSIGFGEDGDDPDGPFDIVIDAPSPDNRPDPCAAFAK